MQRLQPDVDLAEEAEMQRLEGRHSDADASGSSPCAAARANGQPAAAPAASATSSGELKETEARAALVSGYAEHRASLCEKKATR